MVQGEAKTWSAFLLQTCLYECMDLVHAVIWWDRCLYSWTYCLPVQEPLIVKYMLVVTVRWPNLTRFPKTLTSVLAGFPPLDYPDTSIKQSSMRRQRCLFSYPLLLCVRKDLRLGEFMPAPSCALTQ